MIVKFFKKRGSGKASSCKACVDYLLNKPDDTAQILQGDPRLSQAIADSLPFTNTYTAGCLSFSEPNLPDQAKREIMANFEKAMFAGLEAEQYNISWVQHTDKGRLELNFVIPNVELTSQKRLQPYFDKADRPLVENFKQVTNLEYGLSDPNDPSRKQVMITKQELPKDKKQALQAISDGLTALATAGHINDRKDVINALEAAGFEIARVTPKNISIKTDGQNLRLKGAFYEETFRFSDSLSADIAERAREYHRSGAERHQTAREKLDRAITARQQAFSRKYPNRAGEIDKKHRENVPLAVNHSLEHSSLDRNRIGLADVAGEERLSRDDRMGTISGASQRTSGRDQTQDLQSQWGEQALRSSGQGTHQRHLGRKLESSGSSRNQNQQGEKVNGDRDRDTFRAYIEELVRTARERAERFAERIKDFASRKRLNSTAVQRDPATIQRNAGNLDELKRHASTFSEKLSQKQAQKRQEERGMSLF